MYATCISNDLHENLEEHKTTSNPKCFYDYYICSVTYLCERL